MIRQKFGYKEHTIMKNYKIKRLKFYLNMVYEDYILINIDLIQLILKIMLVQLHQNEVFHKLKMDCYY